MCLDGANVSVPHRPGRPVRFRVDRRTAGLSELDVIVTSPQGDALPVEVKGMTGDDEGVDLVEFLPDVQGRYR